MCPHGMWPSASTLHMLVNLAKTCIAARNPMTSTSRRSPIAMIALRRCMERGHPGSDMHISADICIYIYISYITPKTSNWHPEIVRYRLVNIFTRTCMYMHMTVNNRLHTCMYILIAYIDGLMPMCIYIYTCLYI